MRTNATIRAQEKFPEGSRVVWGKGSAVVTKVWKGNDGGIYASLDNEGHLFTVLVDDLVPYPAPMKTWRHYCANCGWFWETGLTFNQKKAVCCSTPDIRIEDLVWVDGAWRRVG